MHALWDSLKTYNVVLTEKDAARKVRVLSLHDQAIGVVQQSEQVDDLGTLVKSVWLSNRVADARRNRTPLGAKQVLYVQYPDLYWLARGLTHATDDYNCDTSGELVRLSEVEALFCKLNILITELRTSNIQELVWDIKHCVARTLAVFTPKVVVLEKEEARELLQDIDEVYDSLRRVNPSKLLAQLVAARRRVFLRQGQIQDIVTEYAIRQQTVLLVTSFLEAQVRIADDFLTRLFAKWDLNVRAHPTYIASQLRQSAELYRTFTVRPFLETFLYVAEEYTQAAQAIERKQFSEAQALLLTAHASFQLRQLRTDLERTVFACSRARHRHQEPDVPATLHALADTRERLQAIDCSRMCNFSVPKTLDGLRCVEAFLEQTVGKATAYQQGYEQLRQTATAI